MKAARTRRRPPVMPAKTDYTDYVGGLAATVERLGPAARALVLEGPFRADDSTLAEMINAIARTELDRAAVDKAIAAAMATIRRASLTPEQTASLNDVDDAMWLAAEHSGEAGYLLGIAVGLQLSPKLFMANSGTR